MTKFGPRVFRSPPSFWKQLSVECCVYTSLMYALWLWQEGDSRWGDTASSIYKKKHYRLLEAMWVTSDLWISLSGVLNNLGINYHPDINILTLWQGKFVWSASSVDGLSATEEDVFSTQLWPPQVAKLPGKQQHYASFNNWPTSPSKQSFSWLFSSGI